MAFARRAFASMQVLFCWLAMALGATTMVSAQLDLPPRLVSNPNRSSFNTFRDSRGRFTVSVPKKDWLVTAGYGPAEVLIANTKSQAIVGIELVPLRVPLASTDIGDTFTGYEIDDLKKVRPGAAGFQTQLRQADDGPLSVVEFVQSDATGEQRIRQYSLPRGLVMYRVVCTAPAAAFPRFDPLFETIAASVKSLPAAAH